jgi:hypothetical protein
MEDCCRPSNQNEVNKDTCPVCEQRGKSVPLITLKALLKASVLETIQPESSYSFCLTPSCDVVYFNGSQIFENSALKVSVFQKDNALDVSVCYCFNWTRERLIQAINTNQHPVDYIKEQVQANRCGCEVNNPQGSCCLGNVTAFIRGLKQDQSN